MAAAAQQAVLTEPPAAVMSALGYAAPIPTVGMVGLVPNARILVATSWRPYPGRAVHRWRAPTRFPITRAVTPSTS